MKKKDDKTARRIRYIVVIGVVVINEDKLSSKSAHDRSSNSRPLVAPGDRTDATPLGQPVSMEGSMDRLDYQGNRRARPKLRRTGGWSRKGGRRAASPSAPVERKATAFSDQLSST